MKKYIKLGIITIGLLFMTYLIIPLPSPLVNDDYSLVVKDENGKTLRVFLNKNKQWCFPPSEESLIPEKLKTAIITFEDAYFNWHPGVNPISILRAAKQNFTEGKIVSGASTITMQLARKINNKPRTFFNKIWEIFLAFKIELYYSKESILEEYLNNAPFGGNIQGYAAAAEKYFEKAPEDLSWSEAATLAVLPNAPGLVSPTSDEKTLKKKRDFLLKKLFESNEFDESTYNLALKEPVLSKSYPFSITAAHLTDRIYKENPKAKIVETTINKEVQQYIEMVAYEHSQSLKRSGISNCAAIVLETKTGKVKAYVGSQNYFDRTGKGMVDGVTAPRSSGSILKPFLYALSMDDGIIVPQTLIKDVQSYYQAFSPRNADEKFNGILPASEALIRSLNIPTVRLLNTFGVYRFYSFLKSANVSTLFRPADDYGLPLIIGGAETNLFDMAALFRGLANDGVFSKPYYVLSDSSNVKNSSVLISPGACYLTLDVIKNLKRPGAEYYWEQYQNQRPIAWKTGTSYGNKDAWAIGVSPDWTIAVWVGNFTGEGNLELAGASSAGPLMFEIFNYLPAKHNNKWFEKADYDFKQVVLCKETGFLAGSNCVNHDTVDVPFSMKPLRLCPFHKKFFIDKATSYAVCSLCWQPNNYNEKNVLVFPADVTTQLKYRGQITEPTPIHNPDCSKISSLNPIEFVYPTDSTKIWLPRDFDGTLQKVIARIAHNQENTNVFWYLDDMYLGNTNDKHELAIEISKGWHNLLVTDESGNNKKVRFYVTRRDE